MSCAPARVAAWNGEAGGVALHAGHQRRPLLGHHRDAASERERDGHGAAEKPPPLGILAGRGALLQHPVVRLGGEVLGDSELPQHVPNFAVAQRTRPFVGQARRLLHELGQLVLAHLELGRGHRGRVRLTLLPEQAHSVPGA